MKVLGKNTTTEVGNFWLVGEPESNNVPAAYVAQYDHALLFAAAPQLKEALEQIGRPGNCCETPGCSIENPCCDAMIARAALLAAEGKGQ